jgi:hypothetical protein
MMADLALKELSVLLQRRTSTNATSDSNNVATTPAQTGTVAVAAAPTVMTLGRHDVGSQSMLSLPTESVHVTRRVVHCCACVSLIVHESS